MIHDPFQALGRIIQSLLQIANPLKRLSESRPGCELFDSMTGQLQTVGDRFG
jgi:hypothetical protein